MSESNTSKSSLFSPETVKDMFLWRRKKLSLLVLAVAAVIWVLLDGYQFNFITVASRLAMIIVILLFLYGNLVRLFRKKEPDFSGLEIPEETALEAANSVRGGIEEGIRWMFLVSAEREWFVFVRAVAVLWLLSYVGSFCDLLTFVYIGMVMGMTVPVTYVKNQDRIRRYGEWMKLQLRKFYDMVNQRVFKKVQSKAVIKEKKEKKVE